MELVVLIVWKNLNLIKYQSIKNFIESQNTTLYDSDNIKLLNVYKNLKQEFKPAVMS